MDNLKNSLKENRVIIIIAIVVIILAIILAIYNGLETDERTIKDLSKIPEDQYVQVNYEVNEYRVVNISELDLLNEYLKDYLNKMINEPEKAWELLSIETQEKFDNDINKYKEYIASNTSIYTINNEVAEYRKSDLSDLEYDIIDTEENKYTIREKSTWDFSITLNGKK